MGILTACVCVCVRVRVCVRACVRVCVRTFGGSEHGGGQFTLLGLYVAEGEPAGVAVGHHRYHVVGSREVTRQGCGLQHRQPDRVRAREMKMINHRDRAPALIRRKSVNRIKGNTTAGLHCI